MKKSLKKMLVLMNCFVVFILSACGSIKGTTYSHSSKIVISNTDSKPKDSLNEKTIYFDQDMEKVELDAKLKVKGGEVKIDLIDSSSGESVWSEEYTKGSQFTIELDHVKAGSEYLLQVQATQTKKVVLEISSDMSLDPYIERPYKELL